MSEKLTALPSNVRILRMRPIASLRVDHHTLLLLDWAERIFVAGLFGWMAMRIVAAYQETGNAANFLLLASEGLVVVFVLFRRATFRVSLRPADWLLAACGTLLPLLVLPVKEVSLLPVKFSVWLVLGGLLLQASAKVTLGRSFGIVAAHRGLMLRGPYRFIRHPIYAGYLLAHAAFLLMNPSLWNLAIYVVAYLAQVPRLFAEERLLSLDPRYREYMSSVRYRLLPGLF